MRRQRQEEASGTNKCRRRRIIQAATTRQFRGGFEITWNTKAAGGAAGSFRVSMSADVIFGSRVESAHDVVTAGR